MLEKRKFGQTGLKTSILGFGCMRLPLNSSDNSDINYQLSTKMLHKAVNQGLNYVDTAYPYHCSKGRNSPGNSEPFLAKALKNGYREKVFIASKMPVWLINTESDMDKFLDEQLKRLEVSYIDFYLAHNLSHNVWEKFQALKFQKFFDRAIKDGRIKHAGFSFHDNYSLFEEILNSYQWSLSQVQYNYLDENYQAGRKGINLAHQKNIAVVVMEPLRGGFLVNNISQENQEIFKQVQPNWSPVDWGLRWLWNQEKIATVLSGMSAMEHVEENLKVAQSLTELTKEEEKAIKTVKLNIQQRLKINCTTCEYCLPCPQGVNIPKSFNAYNNYHLFDGDENQKRILYYYNSQSKPSESAKNCVACGECEEKCPQHLKIAELMLKVKEFF